MGYRPTVVADLVYGETILGYNHDQEKFVADLEKLGISFVESDSGEEIFIEVEGIEMVSEDTLENTGLFELYKYLLDATKTNFANRTGCVYVRFS